MANETGWQGDKMTKKSDYLKVLFRSAFNKLGSKIPIKVYFFVTNNCNLRCPYCLAKDFEHSKEMDTEQIKRIMKEFKELGTVVWNFCGGEPLIRKDIDKLVDYSAELGFVTTMVTNGTFVLKHMDIMKKLDEVMISLEGPEEIHDAIRGKGVFKQVMDSVDELKKNNVKVRLNAVISKTNFKHLDFLIESTKKCPVTFTPLVPQTKEARSYMLSNEELLEVVKKLRKLKETNKKIVAPDEFLQRIEDYVNGNVSKFQEKCLAGKSYVVLSPFGEITHCLDRFRAKELLTEIDVKKQLDSLEEPKCDCAYRCYFMDNLNYSFSPRRIFNLMKNSLKGKGTYQ